MLLMTASAANAAGLVTKHASSVQLTVDAARTTATRIGSSFTSVSSNIDTTDGSTQVLYLLVLSLLVSIILVRLLLLRIPLVPHSPSVNLILKAMQFQLVPTVGTVPNFSTPLLMFKHCWRSCRYCSNYWSTYRNRCGAGSSATGQFVSEITVID